MKLIFNQEMVVAKSGINTTFLIQTTGADGIPQLEVLKVKNPNAEHFVVETIEEAEKVLEDMKQKNPRNRGNYQITNRILTTIREWVLNDINDREFPALDKQFSVLHNKGRIDSEVDVEVPATSSPYNMYLKREEFVSGRTLNSVISQAIRENGVTRDIANRASRTTAKLFVNQLTQPAYYDTNGQPVYLALSDVHAGNVMVNTPEFAQETIQGLQKDNIISADDARRYILQNQLKTLSGIQTEERKSLAIDPIDRTYYMRLSSQDIGFVKMLYSNQSPQEKLQATVSYFLAQPENEQKRQQGVTAEKLYGDIYRSLFREAAVTTISDRLRGRTTQRTELQLMTKLLHEFDRRGINVPLKVRILQKDIAAINKMLAQSGDSNSFSDYLSQRQAA